MKDKITTKVIKAKKDGKTIYPVRRAYLKLAHPEIDIEGSKDAESHIRQEKATYELYGFAYVDDNGIIHMTKVGKEILNNVEKRDEIMLRQLLKYQFPNYVNSDNRYENMHVFLMEIILKMLDELGSLNRYEAAISLIFCCQIEEIKKAIEIVKTYRAKVEEAGDHRPSEDYIKFNYDH